MSVMPGMSLCEVVGDSCSIDAGAGKHPFMLEQGMGATGIMATSIAPAGVAPAPSAGIAGLVMTNRGPAL